MDLEREEGHAALATRESRIRRGRWLLSGGLASLAVAGTSWTVLHAPGLSEVFLLVAVGFLFGAILQGGWGFVRELTIRDPKGGEGGDAIEGRVVASSGVTAPGGVEVVGFRLVGESVRGPVDDAVIAPFELSTADGRRLAVDPTHAELDVEVAPMTGKPDRALVFRWGGDPSDRPWKLGKLANGDVVTVVGTLDGGRLSGSARHPLRVRPKRPS